MAARHGRTDKQLKQRVEKKADNVLSVSAIVGLVLCCAINGAVILAAPTSTRVPVPPEAFWILGAAIVPDAIKFVRGERQ